MLTGQPLGLWRGPTGPHPSPEKVSRDTEEIVTYTEENLQRKLRGKETKKLSTQSTAALGKFSDP